MEGRRRLSSSIDSSIPSVIAVDIHPDGSPGQCQNQAVKLTSGVRERRYSRGEVVGLKLDIVASGALHIFQDVEACTCRRSRRSLLRYRRHYIQHARDSLDERVKRLDCMLHGYKSQSGQAHLSTRTLEPRWFGSVRWGGEAFPLRPGRNIQYTIQWPILLGSVLRVTRIPLGRYDTYSGFWSVR